jgi:hypothetical protein
LPKLLKLKLAKKAWPKGPAFFILGVVVFDGNQKRQFEAPSSPRTAKEKILEN